MKEIESLSDAQLFALARLVHLREFDFGDPALPLWVVHEPLASPPHELEGPAFDREMLGLEQGGWIQWKKPDPVPEQEPQGSEVDAGEDEGGAKEAATPPAAAPSVHADDEVLATDRAMEHMEPLRAELRRRHPDLPADMASLVLLSDLVRSPEGMSENAIQRALEEPPAALSKEKAAKAYRRLVRGGWVFMIDRTGVDEPFFPGPCAWGHAQQVDERLHAMAGEMRMRLADGNADVLELPADSLLRRALREVDRALFVAEREQRLAYRNHPAPIAFDAEGRNATTTSSPNVCSMVVKSLEVQPGNRVLVCGAKAGFTAALCAHIVGPKGRVICLETNPLVAEHARACIKKAGFERRVEVRLVKDVTVGLEGQEPWDAVVVNGKIPKVPRPLVRQMTDGGRLLIFLQSGDSNAQTAYLIRKNGKAFDNRELSTFLFTPIFGEYGYDPPNWQEDLNLIGQELHDVFVSYSTRDQEECDQIVASFEAAGLRCWISARNHPVGKDGYEQAIMEALKSARLFLIVLSHQSIASDHVKNELTNATSLRKLMLPLRLSECPTNLPASFQYHLERHQQFDRDKHTMDQVVAAALQLVGVNAEAESPPRAAPADEPGAPEDDQARIRFEALLDAVLADGRITKTEMKMLVKQALAAGMVEDAAEAMAAVERIVLERNPRAKIAK